MTDLAHPVRTGAHTARAIDWDPVPHAAYIVARGQTADQTPKTWPHPTKCRRSPNHLSRGSQPHAVHARWLRLLTLALRGPGEHHPAVVKPDMRHRHRHRNARDQNDLVAPVDLVGPSRRMAERHLALGRRSPPVLRPVLNVKGPPDPRDRIHPLQLPYRSLPQFERSAS